MNDYKTTILNILEAIDFSDDKKTFVAEFLRNIHLQSLLDLIEMLPNDKREKIKSQLSTNPDNQEIVSETLRTYFSEDQLRQSLQNSAKDAIPKYIQSINQTLSASQRDRLIQVLEMAGSITTASS